MYIRFNELKKLKYGWLDGIGKPLDSSSLDWLSNKFQQNYPDDKLPLPHFYPTPEGNIQAEWSINGWESSLEIDMIKHQGEWHSLMLTTEEEINHILNLEKSEDWTWFVETITNQIKS